MDKRSYFQT